MLRKIFFLFLLVLAALLCIVILMPHTASPSALSTEKVTIATTTLTVEVAHTDAEREQGLSGRTSLLPGHGMLFVFDQPGQYGFWMKDMNFSLDIIFIDHSLHVVTIDSNLSPSTYPQVFYPMSPALYVLEVPSGFAAEHNIAEGSSLVLQ